MRIGQQHGQPIYSHSNTSCWGHAIRQGTDVILIHQMGFIVAALSVFMIFVAPIWALIVMALSVTIIWALTAFPEDFDEA